MKKLTGRSYLILGTWCVAAAIFIHPFDLLNAIVGLTGLFAIFDGFAHTKNT